MLIIRLSGTGNSNELLNLIKKDNENFIDKIYLDEPKYQFFIKKREDAGKT